MNAFNQVATRNRTTELELLFKGLVWPAVAGNVAWSFLSIVFAASSWTKAVSVTIPSAIALLFAAIFLFKDWLQLHDDGKETGNRYWQADAVYAFSISCFAVLTASGKISTAFWPLALALFVGMIGNFLNAWNHFESVRWSRFHGNFVGLGVLLGGGIMTSWNAWILPISISIPLLVWYLTSEKKEIQERGTAPAVGPAKKSETTAVQWSPWKAWWMDLLKSIVAFAIIAAITATVLDRYAEREAERKSQEDIVYEMRVDALREFRKATIEYDVAARSAFADLYQWKGKDKTPAMSFYEQAAYAAWNAATEEALLRQTDDLLLSQYLAALVSAVKKRHSIYDGLVDARLDGEESTQIRPAEHRSEFDRLSAIISGERAKALGRLEYLVLQQPRSR